jgi:hypothetical protein
MPLFWDLFARWVLPALFTGGFQFLGAHKQAGASRYGAELQAGGTQRALDYEIEEDKYQRERDEEQRARDWRLEQIDRDRAEVDRQRAEIDRQRNIGFEATDRRRQQEYEDLLRGRYQQRGDLLAPWLNRAGQNRGRLSSLLAQGPAISPEAIARQDPRLLESGRPDLLAGGSAMQVADANTGQASQQSAYGSGVPRRETSPLGSPQWWQLPPGQRGPAMYGDGQLRRDINGNPILGPRGNLMPPPRRG